MNQIIFKRLLAGGVLGMVTGATAIGYSFLSKNTDAFFTGAVLMLTGMQCAMNSHVALLRSSMVRGIKAK